MNARNCCALPGRGNGVGAGDTAVGAQTDAGVQRGLAAHMAAFEQAAESVLPG